MTKKEISTTLGELNAIKNAIDGYGDSLKNFKLKLRVAKLSGELGDALKPFFSVRRGIFDSYSEGLRGLSNLCDGMSNEEFISEFSESHPNEVKEYQDNLDRLTELDSELVTVSVDPIDTDGIDDEILNGIPYFIIRNFI